MNNNLSGFKPFEKLFKESFFSPSITLICENCLKPGRKMHTKLCQSCFEYWALLRRFPPIERKSAVKRCALCDCSFTSNYKRITCGNVCKPCYNMKEEAGEIPNKKPKRDTPTKEPEHSCYHKCLKCSTMFVGSDVLDILLCPDCHTSENSPHSRNGEDAKKQPDLKTTQTPLADELVVANQYDGTATCNVSPQPVNDHPIEFTHSNILNNMVEGADMSQMQYCPTNNAPIMSNFHNSYPNYGSDQNMYQYHYQADQAQWDCWNFNDQFSYSNYPCQDF